MKKILASKLMYGCFFAAIGAWLWIAGHPGALEANAPPMATSAAGNTAAPNARASRVPEPPNPFDAQLAKQKLEFDKRKGLASTTAIEGAENRVPLGRDPFADFLQQQQRNVKASPFAEPAVKP